MNGVFVSNKYERNALKKVYPSRKWAKKVDSMSDDQVFSIYMRLKAKNHRI